MGMEVFRALGGTKSLSLSWLHSCEIRLRLAAMAIVCNLYDYTTRLCEWSKFMNWGLADMQGHTTAAKMAASMPALAFLCLRLTDS